MSNLPTTSDSANRSADSAESLCNQELQNLVSLGGRLALELECLLLDTKDMAVVSKYWGTGMDALDAWRSYMHEIIRGE